MNISFKKNWTRWLVVLMAAIYTVYISYLGIMRQNAFASGYDLANMTDTVWQTSRGHIFDLTGDTGLVSRFTAHTDLILVFLAPLYKLFSSPDLLLVVQALAVGISVIPIYLISKQVLKSEVLGVIVGLVFLISPNTLWANMYDFHPVLLAIPLLFFTLYFMMTKRWVWFWIVIILSLLTKENVGLFVAMMGIIAFFQYKEKRVGLIMFIGGTIFSVAAVLLVMPHFSGGKQHWAWGWYNLTQGIIPRFIKDLTNADALMYYRDLLVPYGFLPLLALPWMLPALPDLVINLTSNHAETRSLVFHYQALTIVAMTIALIMALSYLQRWKKLRIAAVLFMLFWAVHQNYYYSPLPSTPAHWQLMYTVGSSEINFDRVLKEIPEQATVASSSEVRPHVINHSLSYNLPGGAETADYIALVSENRLVGNYNPKPYESQLLNKLLNDPNYQMLYGDRPFYLFKKLK